MPLLIQELANVGLTIMIIAGAAFTLAKIKEYINGK